MNVWYLDLVVLIFATSYLKTETCITGKGYFVEEGSHRHVVLVIDQNKYELYERPFEKFLVTGIVLNSRLVLTLAEPVKHIVAHELTILAGIEIPVQTSIYYMDIYQIYEKIEQPDAKPEYALILLRTHMEMKFNVYISNVFHGLARNTNRYLHCELVTWYLNTEGSKWIKTRIFVNPEQSGCESQQEFCIRVLLKSKIPINPCVHHINLGAPLMCDVSLEGIFIGEGETKCTKPEANSVNKALLLEKNQNVSKWLYNLPVKTFYNYYDDDDDYEDQEINQSDQKLQGYDWQSGSDFAENDLNPSDKEDDMVVLNNRIYYRKKCLKN